MTALACAVGCVASCAVVPGSGDHPSANAIAKGKASLGPPYPVRELTVPLVDPSRPTVSDGMEVSDSRALTTLLWVPQAPGRRPLVVFAPGFGVGPTPYEALLATWAEQGYVVAAIEFPLTDSAVAGTDLDEHDLQNQPEDVDFVTRALVAPGSPVRSRIDPSKVALAGHSDGGETVLVASFRNGAPGTPRFRAVIAMSVRPLDAVLPAANPPILMTQGDEDTIDPPANGYRAYADAAAPKYLAVIHGGGHLEPVELGSPWFHGVAAVTTAFLNCYLSGRGSPSLVLAAGNQGSIWTTQTP